MRIRLLVPIAVLALAAAACGGSMAEVDGVASLDDDTAAPQSEGTEAPGNGEVDAEEAFLAFTECMRENGVDIDDPTVDADGNLSLAFGGPAGDLDFDALESARIECEQHLEGVTLGFDRGDESEFEDTLLEYAQCMRDNGVEMDDPDFSSFGPGAEPSEEGEPQARGPFGDIDPDDPAFQAAQEVCGDILSGFAPGGGVGGPPPEGGA